MENKKLSFEVDASQIDIKPLLKKDFLELSMRAISSANPNRNNSWFTKESMEKSLHTFRNKPILGYFENDDFVSHNGDWQYDSETQMDYWDTLGKKGERILGLIRSEDEIKIVEDKKGLSWITFTCALWSQYSYKQVKRLLKDAKRAKTQGGATKNISVEVDITDYEELDNGVIKINEFNLVGVTILGSRNGVKVEPGIEDAELSVIDIMGRDIYAKQEKALRLAYEKLDGSDKNKKEASLNMEEEKTIIEEPSVEVFDRTVEQSEPVVEEHFEEKPEEEVEEKPEHCEEEVCPDCGKNPCECEKEHCEEEKPEEEPKAEEESCKHCEEEKPEQCEEEKACCEEEPKEEEPEDDDHDEEEDPEDEHDEEPEEEHKECEKSEWEIKCEEYKCKYEEIYAMYEKKCHEYEELEKKCSEYEGKITAYEAEKKVLSVESFESEVYVPKTDIVEEKPVKTDRWARMRNNVGK